MSPSYQNHKNRMRKKLRDVLCLALGFIMLASPCLCGVRAFAISETSDPTNPAVPTTPDYTYNNTFAGFSESPFIHRQNAYMLTVATGNSAGDNVSCFEIRYKSGSPVVHSEFVFPDAGKHDAYAVGYDSGISLPEEKNAQLMQYTLLSLSGYSRMNMIPNECNDKALRINSDDQLYFTTTEPIEELVDIRVHASYKSGGNNTWAFKSLALFEVSAVHGLINEGTVSPKYYTPFDGTLIARSLGSGSCTTSGRSAFFTFSFTANDSKFKLSDTFVNGSSEYKAENDAVILAMDIADVAGASISDLETDQVRTLHRLMPLETLRLEVIYDDMFGKSRSVFIPFITSCYTEMSMAMGKDADNKPILGVFQQGDTMACNANLPFCVNVTKCRLMFSKTAADFSGVLPECSQETYNYHFKDPSVSISALRVYDGTKNALSYHYNGTNITPVISGADPVPECCWVSVAYAGTSLAVGSSPAALPMTKYEQGVRTKASVGSNTYLIAISTDGDATKSGTVNDLYISLDYTKTNGMANTTEEYSLRKQSDNFYGDWTSLPKRMIPSFRYLYPEYCLSEYGYFYYISPGRTLYFTVNLSDVSSFTGATLRLDGSDEWQMSSLDIYQLAALGNRNAQWTDSTVTGQQEFSSAPDSFDSDRIITRDFDGIQCVQYANKVLLQANESKSLSFSNGNVSQKDIEWEQYTYYMSYEDTKLDFGFTKSRLTYEVAVKVGDDADGDSDCGSKNQFYFQLVFMNGKSGYVLANQQLSADGFRTGKEERFEISVNRDYGDLRAIHIIPQNPNDDKSTFDKLKIDYINVSKKENSGINLTWKVEINDWISIDYNDSGAQDSVSGQSGKSESDIARTYVVTGTGYSTNILVAVTTGGYNNSVQFSGHIFADIRYRDSNGVDQTLSGLDVTQLMLEYAGKSASGKIAVNGTECAANDKSFMLRAYHTDRFMISIDDVSQLQSIQFCVYSNETGTWNISNVSMYLMNSAGQRTINANQEYEIACEKSLLTTSDTDTFQVPFTNKPTYSPEIQLADNQITVSDWGNKALTATVDYVPQNKDDTMNVYVYMSDDATSIDLYDMKCAVSYAVNLGQNGSDTITDKIYQKAITLRADPAGKVYYATGVSASGLINICSTSLQADSYSYITAHVNRVVIEHVRSGVAIETYNIPFYGAAAYPLAVTGSPSSSSDGSVNYRQTVEFMMTDDTASAILGYKSDDIAVAITYDSLNGKSSHSLTSPNVFLSETDTNIIKGGTVCTVNFRQSDVSKITGIQFIAMGKIIGNAGIKNAYAANYYVDQTGKETCLGWYSFGLGVSTLSSGARSASLTASSVDDSLDSMTVSPVTLTVKTAEAAQNIESGTNSPVRMRLSYYDNNGNERTQTFDDINAYALSGSTATGKTLTAKVLVNNLSALRSVEFAPYEPEYGKNPPSWSIENVNILYSVKGTQTELTRAVGSTATENDPVTINLSTASMSINVFSYNSATNASYNKVFTGTGTAFEGILIDTAGKITFTPSIGGSSMGATCECYRIANGMPISANDAITIQGTSARVRNVVFGGVNIKEGQYRIVFTSVEFPDMSLAVNIIVDAPDEPTTEETTTEEITTQETTSEEISEEGTSSELFPEEERNIYG